MPLCKILTLIVNLTIYPPYSFVFLRFTVSLTSVTCLAFMYCTCMLFIFITILFYQLELLKSICFVHFVTFQPQNFGKVLLRWNIASFWFLMQQNYFGGVKTKVLNSNSLQRHAHLGVGPYTNSDVGHKCFNQNFYRCLMMIWQQRLCFIRQSIFLSFFIAIKNLEITA